MTTAAITSSPTPSADSTRPPVPARNKAPRRLLNGAIAVAFLALGAAGGAGAYYRFQKHHPRSVLLLQPAPIAQQMTDPGPVAVKGRVAEVFGNKFIIQDESGRTLVDTGPRGEGATPVAKDDTITVQGHFDRGVIHADVVTRADGTSEEFGPGEPPHRDHGPGREAPPPPAR